MKFQSLPLYYLVLICGSPIQADSSNDSFSFGSRSTRPLNCDGLTFSNTECPDGGSTSFPEGKCVTADIVVVGGNGRSGSYSSATTSCTTENGCAWTCYTDKHCSSEPAECAGGYSSLSCNCVNINWSWSVQINGDFMVSWQGYNAEACNGIDYYFSDCVNRVIDECTGDPYNSPMAKGTCTNSHTMELCSFEAFDDINFPVPYDDIKCPSCNASRTDSYDPSAFAMCSPDNLRCFDQCEFDTCINNLPAPYLYGCEDSVIKRCDMWGVYNTNYGINHVSGTCINPMLSETCKFEINCANEEGNDCSPYEYFDLNRVITTVTCSTCTAKQASEGDVSENGCSPVNCLPDCNHGKHNNGGNNNGTSNTKWIIIGSSVGGGALLLAAAVASTAIIIYKCIHKAGYQRIGEN